jgi:hypothetical protein
MHRILFTIQTDTVHILTVRVIAGMPLVFALKHSVTLFDCRDRSAVTQGNLWCGDRSPFLAGLS